jgi:dephospho-CoA kinase
LLEHFGDGAAASPGPGGGTKQLDRSALADIVFSDASKRLALEAITHPLIRAEVLRRAALADNVAVAHNGVVVIEIPLLDERRKVDYRLDVVVLVDTPDDLAVQRAMGRGMTEPAARARMAAQPSSSQRRALADRSLANDGSLDDLENAVDELWGWLVQKGAPGSA